MKLANRKTRLTFITNSQPGDADVALNMRIDFEKLGPFEPNHDPPGERSAHPASALGKTTGNLRTGDHR